MHCNVHSVVRPVESAGVQGLIADGALTAWFQPILKLDSAGLYAHEALIRGPERSALHLPDALFALARAQGCETALELACLQTAIRSWANLRAPGRLFANVSANAFMRVFDDRGQGSVLETMSEVGMAPTALVLELTEHTRVQDTRALMRTADAVRGIGIGLAVDDFGDGRSSLRLWSELKPDIVKIDKYFAIDIATHGEKLQVLRALMHIAEVFGTTVVVEGLENAEDLRVVRDLGVSLGQGFLLGRPAPTPVREPASGARAVLESRHIAVFPELRRVANRRFTAERFLVDVPNVQPTTTNEEVMQLFHAHEQLHTTAVVGPDGVPIAVINRERFLAQYTKPFFKEVYGRKPCTLLANTSPLVVDVHAGIDELTSILTSADQRYLTDGFVITEAARYRGIGTGEQLVRAVTELRIEAARHANPLTFLPGNIPITDHIARLLDAGVHFVACYGDLNHFKPFNDHYGYWRGDEMIRLAARAFVTHCDGQRDFVGHVGGDDFVVLFQSENWVERCARIVETFDTSARMLYDDEVRLSGGISAEDRHGVLRFFPYTTLSIGAVPVEPGAFREADAVANAAASAKHAAKVGGKGLHVAG